MSRSFVRLACFALLLAVGAWCAWRPLREERSRCEGTVTDATAGEVGHSPGELALQPPHELHASHEESDPASEAVASTSALKRTPSESSRITSEATWLFRIVARDSGAAQAGITLTLHAPDSDQSILHGDSSRGRLGEWIVSDDQGRAEYLVPAGEASVLEVNAEGAAAEVGRVHRALPPLVAGERRELEIPLAVGFDGVWFGRIVDGSSGEPLAGARARSVTGNPFDTSNATIRMSADSASDGSVQLVFSSWCSSFASIEHPGYASGFVHLEAGHEQRSSALDVRLVRAASLALHVIDAAGSAKEGLPVAVSFSPVDRMQGRSWAASNLWAQGFGSLTDAEGRCMLEALPPEVPLTLEVYEDAKVLRRGERCLRLEPGERRELDWTVGACTLAGRTLEADGSPVADVSVWVLPVIGSRFLDADHASFVTTETRSGANGRFTASLSPGDWYVGPAPERDDPRSPDRRSGLIAPVATRITIAPEQTSAEITLTCSRGAFLRGTVRGPGGERIGRGYISAHDDQLWAGRNFEDGEFSLGPLPSGAYLLQASAPDEAGLADSAPRTFTAGTEGIELVLRQGARLPVCVLDSRGNVATDVSIWLLPGHGLEGGNTSWWQDGAGSLDNVLPGTYSLCATTSAGEFALERGLELDAGRAPHEVVLHLEPAPSLRVEVLPRPDDVNAEVRFDGSPIWSAWVEENPTTLLAPGEYEVVLYRSPGSAPEEIARKRVRVAAEGETRVVFDLDVSR